MTLQSPSLIPRSIRPLAALTVLVLTTGSLAAQTGATAEPAAEAAGTGAAIQATPESMDDLEFSPGDASTTAPAELEEIYAPKDGYLDALGLRNPIDFLTNPLDELYQNTGLRIGFATTTLFMQPLGGQSNDHGAAGDFDLMTSWTLIGRGTKNTGRLVATGEYRYDIGNQPPSVLGSQMGTLVNPAGSFNDRGEVVRDLYWVQRLFDARLRIMIGRAAPDDYVGAHWLQNVNNSFTNRHFSANAAVPWPGHGPLLGASIVPNDLFYVTAGASNAYGDTTRAEVSSLFDEWDLFTFAEVGYTPTLEGLGTGRYAFGIWNMDARGLSGLPSDHGITVIADQNINDQLQVFARYGYSDGILTNIRQFGQVGLGYSGLTGREFDLTGLAVSVAEPRSGDSRTETVLEGFHRFQINRNSQLSIGAQLIANPGNAENDDTTGTIYARLRTSF